MRTLTLLACLFLVGALVGPLGAGQDPPQRPSTGPGEPDGGTSEEDAEDGAADGSGSEGNSTGPGETEEQRQHARSCYEAFQSGEYDDAPPAPDDPCRRYYEYWRSQTNSTAMAEERRRQAADIQERRADFLREWPLQGEAEWKQRVEEARLSHEKLQQVPAAYRDRVGAIIPDATGYHGTFISFIPDPEARTISNVTLADTTLFVVIRMPGSPNGAATSVAGNLLKVDGTAWQYHLVDSPGAAMVFQTRTDDRPYHLEVPVAAQVTWTTQGAEIRYARAGGEPLVATLRGDVAPDPADPSRIVVGGEARFLVSAKRVVLEQITNQLRDQIEGAAVGGRLGAEMSVLRSAQVGGERLVDDTVLYADLDLTVSTGAATEDGPDDAYTITVDSASHSGKTLAVSFESGLLDVEDLQIRYFNVEGDVVVEAPIKKATSLQDVLDPEDDGVIAEYRIVEDADGAMALLSIPHFSEHRIEFSSLGKAIVDEPSLVIGTIGAIALIAVAAVGMVRRPRQ